tara:strand:+ start:225 stop:371 length:147 start_codon:yes stop_codon:yes gene_type:complete
MKIGDLVLCGTHEHLGMVIGWDESRDPVVWCFKYGGSCAMYYNQVKLL